VNINGYSILTLNIKDGLDYKLATQVSFKLPAVFFYSYSIACRKIFNSK